MGCRRAYLHDKDGEQVQKDGNVGRPREALQRPDLAEHEAGEHKDDETEDEADAGPAVGTLGDLRDGLAVAEDQDGDEEEELETLAKVDQAAGDGAKDTVVEVTKPVQGVSVRVETQESLPDQNARAN